MNCKICNNETSFVFAEKVLRKYDVKYYQCPTCLFMQTENPYWLSEAYESAINVSDTGIVVRNEKLRKIVGVLLFMYFKRGDRFIDYAGGYGLFTRMMRDVGFDFYWADEYADNLLARGFGHKEGIKYQALTAFEVFEHLGSPLEEIEKMLHFSDTIIFSTVLLPDSVPQKNWWYYGFNHGQHVGVYHYKTLQFLAGKLGLYLYTDKSSYHILSRKKLSFCNISFVKRLNKLGLFGLVKLSLISKTDTDHLYLADTSKPNG